MLVASTGAAIGAAREGVSVLLVERYGFLGGEATGGLVNTFMATPYDVQEPPPRVVTPAAPIRVPTK